jgi:eukaryotic-like serine/threonine-protein kinase
MFASAEAYDRPNFAMEYLQGGSLRARIRRGHIPLSEIVEITGQVCDALNAAHNREIVHRDIKRDKDLRDFSGQKLVNAEGGTRPSGGFDNT